MHTDGYDDRGDYYSAECDDDEMPATERELAEDAQWKVIQKNTFTRWTNEHLKQANKSIADLEFDLSDGLRLCALIEVLSGKKFKRINKRPNFRSQKLENVTTALKFLEDDEGIKIVNIDSTDIVDSKLKLILGLIWTLILHYSISMPMWEGEEDMPVSNAKEGPTPKQRLLIWVQNKLPDLPIRNFTTDWNDGKAIGALVDAVGPGLCPDWEDWDKKKGKENAKEAMDLAEEWLDVPQLIKPEEMVNPKVDELSMMTYLSQFPNARLKPGAPLRPRTNPARVRAYGPGLEKRGNCKGLAAKFKIDTFAAGQGQPSVTVTNPLGKAEQCECVFNNDRNLTYSCQYMPSMEGLYTVKITFAGKEIPKSPYQVNVEGAAGDAERVTAAGPGLETNGVQAGKKTFFEVYTEGAGVGIVEVIIVDAHGHKDSVKPRISKSTETTYYVEYMAKEVGRYSVHIYFAGKEIPLSPYTVIVAAQSGAAAPVKKPTSAPNDKKGPPATKKPASSPGDAVEPKKAYASGRGVQPKGVRIKDVADIKVHTENAGKAEVTGTLVGPTGGDDSSDESDSEGREEPLRFRKIDANTYETTYTPTKPGEYTVNLLYGGNHIAKSPFKVNVGPFKESKIRAYGPGLEGGIVNKPADFVVETNGETGALGFAIEGPSQAKINCNDNGDGSADVSYMPTAPGEYAVHVLCDNEDIPKSPFMAMIAPTLPSSVNPDKISPEQALTAESAPNGVNESPISPESSARQSHSMIPSGDIFEPSEVVASGPGLQRNGVIQGQPAVFTIDTKKAGKAPLKVYGEDVEGRPVDIQVRDNRDGTYSCQYKPKQPIKHTIIVTYGGVNVPKSPFRVYVEEPAMPEKVKVFGPGIEKGVVCSQPTHFFVDCTEAGPGDVAISLTDDKGMDVPVDADDNGEGLFRIQYEPKSVGTYTANVIFAETEIPTSPYKIMVEPDIDVSGVKVQGLEKRFTVRKMTSFAVKYNAKVRKLFVSVVICSPSGKILNPLIRNNYDGCNVSFTPREVGNYTIEVYAHGKKINDSPFIVESISDGKPLDDEKQPVKKIKFGGANQPDDEKPSGRKPWQKPAPDTTDDAKDKKPAWAKKTPKPNKDSEKPIAEDAIQPQEASKDEASPGKPSWSKKPWQKPKPGDDQDDKNKPKRRFGKPQDDQPEWMNASLKPWQRKPKPQAPTDEEQPDRPSDASKVKVYGDGITKGTVNEKSVFTVDTTSSGPGDVSLDFKGPNVPQWTKTEVSKGKYEISYTPTLPGTYVISINFNGAKVPASPFRPEVKPKRQVNPQASKVKVYGDGIKSGTVNQTSSFVVDTTQAGSGKLGFSVNGPSELKLVPKNIGFRKCEVSYKPVTAGEYSIDVLYDESPVPGAPFKPVVKSSTDDSPLNKVKVYGDGIKSGIVNQVTRFVVDTTESGPGKLGFNIKGPGKAPLTAKDIGPGKCEVSYTPTLPGEYTIDVTYNEQSLPSAPFTPTIATSSSTSKKPIDLVKVYGDGVTTGTANQVCKFVVDTTESGPGKLGFNIKGPGRAPLSTKEIAPGKCEVSYTPVLAGEYAIDVTYNAKSLPTAPFKPKITTTKSKKPVELVKVYGDGVTAGTTNQVCKFVVDTTESGPGKLGFNVKGPGRAPLTTKDIAPGKCEVSYTPTLPGEYTIDVTYSGTPVPGTPLRPKIVNAKTTKPVDLVKVYGDGISTGTVNQATKFVVDTTESGAGKLGFNVKGPGRAPLATKDIAPGKCEVSYTPTLVGEYAIDVTYNGALVPGAPFKPKVSIGKPDEKKLRPIDKVKILGNGVTTGFTSQPNKFVVDMTESGPGRLGFNVKGPGKAEITAKDIMPNKCEVSYTPSMPGTYEIDVTYNDELLPNAPFKPDVKPGKVDHAASKVKVYGNGMESGEINRVCSFVVDSSVAGSGNIEYSIQGPSQPKLTKKNIGFRKSEVSYTPTEAGEYVIDVLYNGTAVTGSPFKPVIKHATDVNAQKVVVIGESLEMGKTNQPNKFVVDTSLAGPGQLGFNVQGPGKATIHTEDLGNGKCEVSYTPTLVGDYSIDVTYNSSPVPGSPFKPKVTFGAIELASDKVKVLGNGILSGKTNERNTFIVDTTESGPGKLSFNMHGPSEAKLETVNIGNGQCEVCYIPLEKGDYKVDVLYNGVPIKGSPFTTKVDVGSSLSPAKKVKVHGEGIKSGKVDQCNSFVVDTSESGPGALSFNVQGPKTLQLTKKQIASDKVEVSYVPTAVGEYTIDITFNNEPINEIPFKCQVKETGKESKVLVSGLGALLGRSGEPSTMIIDTREAGIGKLDVKVDGPGDAPCKTRELVPGKHEITYTPSKPGAYSVDVLFDGKSVPGSPFKPKVELGVADQQPSDKVVVKGEGIQSGKVGEVAKFVVDTAKSGPGELSFKVAGPTSTTVNTKELGSNKCEVLYTPTKAGVYSIDVLYNGQSVPGSPFVTDIKPSVAKKLECSQTGVVVQSENIEKGVCNDKLTFTVDTSKPGPGKLDFDVNGPSKPIVIAKEVDANLTEVSCLPMSTGMHSIDVKYNGKSLSNGPFNVEFAPVSEVFEAKTTEQKSFAAPTYQKCSVTKVKVDSKEMKPTSCNDVVSFIVDTTESGPGKLGFDVKGPTQAKIVTEDIGSNKCKVSFIPIKEGFYTANVLFNGKPLTITPLTCSVQQSDVNYMYVDEQSIPAVRCKETNIVLKGHGIESGECNKPSKFVVDLREVTGSSTASLKFNIKGPSKPVMKAVEIAPSVYEVSYTASVPGAYTIDVLHNDKVLSHSPVANVQRTQIESTSVEEVHSKPVVEHPDDVPVLKCTDTEIEVRGHGVVSGVKNEKVAFIIDTSKPGPGKLGFKLSGPAPVQLNTLDLGQGLCEISYVPTVPGEYVIEAMYNNKQIFGKPIVTRIQSSDTESSVMRTDGSFNSRYDETVSMEKLEDGQNRETVTKRTSKNTSSGNFYSKEIVETTETRTLSQSQPDAHTKTFGSGSEEIVEMITASEAKNVELVPGGAELFAKELMGTDVVIHTESSTEDRAPITEDVIIQRTDSKKQPTEVDGSISIKNFESQSTREYRKILGEQLVEADSEFQIETVEENRTPVSEDILIQQASSQQKSAGQVVTTDITETIDLSGLVPQVSTGISEDIQVSKTVEVLRSENIQDELDATTVRVTEMSDNTDLTFSVNNQDTTETIELVETVELGDTVNLTNTDDQFYISASTSEVQSTDVYETDDIEAAFTISPDAIIEESFENVKGSRQIERSPAAKFNIESSSTVSETFTSEPQNIQFVRPQPTALRSEEVVTVIEESKRAPASGPASLVVVEGDCLKRSVANSKQSFIIDVSKSGAGKLNFATRGPGKATLNAKNLGDNKFEVVFAPTEIGTYMIEVTFNGQPVSGSPFFTHVTSDKNLDVSSLNISKLDDHGVFMDATSDFVVDASSVTPTGEGKVRAIVTNPSGTKNDTMVTNNGDGTYNVAYTPYEKGPHQIDVSYEGLPIPHSPFKVNAVPGNDPSRVKAYGPGLENGVTNQPQQFTIETRGAGPGGLSIAVEGPSKAAVNCVDNHDGTCSVEYTPLKPGDYDICVKFDGNDIPGSPFAVPVNDKVDPSKVRVYGPGLTPDGARASLPASFSVDCTDAGKAPLNVTVDDGSGFPKPVSCQEVDDQMFECTYVPNQEGPCKVNVMYDDEPVPGSPFTQNVLPTYDASKVTADGPGIEDGAPASLPTHFVVDTSKAGVADLDVSLQAPDGRYLRPEITDNKDATVTVNYTPEDVGKYNAKIKYGGEPIPGSPFEMNTQPSGDASKCQITDSKKKVVVDEECVITVNTADAGMGNITCRIRTPSDTDADIDIVDNNDGTVSIYYTPHTPGTYGISIKFGGVPIPEGDYEVEALTEEQMAVDEADIVPMQKVNGLQSGAPGFPNLNMFHPVDFVIPVGPIFAYVFAEVESPSGQRSPVKVTDNGDGTVTINYQPTEVGLHNLHVSYNNEPLEGSPYQFYVDAVDSGVVAAYGPGLSYGVAGEPCTFTIDTKNAGAGGVSIFVSGPSRAPVDIKDNGNKTLTAQFTPKVGGEYTVKVLQNGKDVNGSPFKCKVTGGLSLAVEGPSKAEIACVDNDDGTCTVTYLPTEPGLYSVVVKFDDEHIMGSPFTSYIAGEPNKEKAQLSMGQASEFSLSVEEYDINTLEADITSPSGKMEPCMLKKLPNGHLGISFTPHETGTHLVNVYKDGQHIANSPFKINVTRNEVGHADKVKVYGDGLTRGTANEDNEFIVDTRDAGYGGLSLSIEGPSKADIDCKDRPDGTTAVVYKPTQGGTYVISIKFADEHVPGSPFHCKVGGLSTNKEESRLVSHEKAADVTHVGSVCELSLKVPGSDPMEMLASVTSPSGVTELCDIIDLSDDHYTIKFVPKEMGVHTVCVKHKGLNIPGSPFQFTVGPITQGGAHKVKANGPGLERGEVNHNNEFNIYTREAGSGGLQISVEGPSKANIQFEDKKDGSCVVSYNCTDPGEYVVSVKFNDEHIPDSPFRVPVLPSSGDARKITVQALKQKGLEIGKPAAFTCVYNGASGNLSAKVVAPSGAEDEALIQALDDSNAHFAVRFIPRENGVHYVHVMLDRAHIRGSPFRVIVGDSVPDPGQVTAKGDGLVRATTGANNKFQVNTVGAGASSLAVTIDGPSKVKLDAKEIGDGYEFCYTPSAPGSYYITIKYGGNSHIAGSPFKVACTGSGKPSGKTESAHCVIDTKVISEADAAKALPKFNSDGSKVASKGLGLTKAFVNKKAQFTVDSSQAGHNMLFVGMVGPANSPPVDEIHIKHAMRNVYNVSYTVKQKGKYLLLVKWGDDHIPGSPFNIEVV